MLFRRSIRISVIGAALALVLIPACSKDDEDEDEGVSTENEADAAKATAKALSGVMNPGNALTETQRLQLRSLYTHAKAQRLAFASLLDETTPEDETTPDLGDFDLCEILQTSCTEKATAFDTGVDGESCKQSCSSDKKTQIYECSSEASEYKCGDVTYTLGGSSTTSSSTCTSKGDGAYTFDMTANFGGSISGGSITDAAELKCEIALSFSFDPSETSSAPAEETIDCDQFSCTLDGEPISCEAMKESFAADECK